MSAGGHGEPAGEGPVLFLPLLSCLLPAEGTGRKQPHSCSGPLSGALHHPASFIVSFHVLRDGFPGDVQRWGPRAGGVAGCGVCPGATRGWRNLLGLLSLLSVPSRGGEPGLCSLLRAEAPRKQVSPFTSAGAQLDPSMKPA